MTSNHVNLHSCAKQLSTKQIQAGVVMLTPLPYHAPVSSSALWWFRDAFLMELLIIYLLPTFISLAKHHPETGKIILVNLLFGWTGIGSLFALIAAVRSPTVIELHVCRNCHSVGTPNVRNIKCFFAQGLGMPLPCTRRWCFLRSGPDPKQIGELCHRFNTIEFVYYYRSSSAFV